MSLPNHGVLKNLTRFEPPRSRHARRPSTSPFIIEETEFLASIWQGIGKNFVLPAGPTGEQIASNSIRRKSQLIASSVFRAGTAEMPRLMGKRQAW
jgi:hypothetical protein